MSLKTKRRKNKKKKKTALAGSREKGRSTLGDKGKRGGKKGELVHLSSRETKKRREKKEMTVGLRKTTR